jgi:hypothetical protein
MNLPVEAVVAPIEVPFIVPLVAVKVPAVILFAAFDRVKAVPVDAPRPVTLAKVSASVAVKVIVPPRETVAPPDRIPLLLIVIDELAKLALVIPAVPDKLEFVSPAIVVGVTDVTLP